MEIRQQSCVIVSSGFRKDTNLRWASGNILSSVSFLFNFSLIICLHDVDVLIWNLVPVLVPVLVSVLVPVLVSVLVPVLASVLVSKGSDDSRQDRTRFLTKTLKLDFLSFPSSACLKGDDYTINVSMSEITKVNKANYNNHWTVKEHQPVDPQSTVTALFSGWFGDWAVWVIFNSRKSIEFSGWVKNKDVFYVSFSDESLENGRRKFWTLIFDEINTFGLSFIGF